MGYLAPLFLIITAYLVGVLVQTIFCDSDGRITKSCLVGTFFLLILWEALLLLFDWFSMGFAITVKVYSATILGLTVLSLVIGRYRIKLMITKERMINIVPVLILFLCLLLEITVYRYVVPDFAGELAVEKINTVLTTDMPYGYDCLTGMALTEEMPLLDKIVNLPLLYGYMCSLFETSPFDMVYKCIPVWVTVLEYMVYGLWSDLLFEKDDKKNVKTVLFICGVTALNICGAFSKYSIFYYLTFKGFSGETVMYLVIFPYALYEMIYGFSSRKSVSYAYVVLAGICSLFATGIERGIVPFMFMIIICLMIMWGYRFRRYLLCRKS